MLKHRQEKNIGEIDFPGIFLWDVLPNKHFGFCLKRVPSGNPTVCDIENGHRNSGFTH